MNIFQTFELFLKKPLSILKHGLISIVHLRVDSANTKTAINADFVNKKAQITVINNEKVYNLLKMVSYRAQKKEEKTIQTEGEPVNVSVDKTPLISETVYEYPEDNKG